MISAPRSPTLHHRRLSAFPEPRVDIHFTYLPADIWVRLYTVRLESSGVNVGVRCVDVDMAKLGDVANVMALPSVLYIRLSYSYSKFQKNINKQPSTNNLPPNRELSPASPLS